MNRQDAGELAADFRHLTHDINRWAWVFDVNKHQRGNYKKQLLAIEVSEQGTFIRIEEEDFSATAFYRLPFDKSLGSEEGPLNLLRALHIKLVYDA